MSSSARGARLTRRDPSLNEMINGSTRQLLRRHQFGALPGTPLMPATGEASADAISDDMTTSQEADDWNWSEVGLKRSPEPVLRSVPVRRAPWRPDW